MAEHRLGEEELYQQVVDELEAGDRKDGLWAKSLAAANGDLAMAKSRYIRKRVQSIKDERTLKAHEDRATKHAILEAEVRKAIQAEQELVKALGQRGYVVHPHRHGYVIREPLGARVRVGSPQELKEYCRKRIGGQHAE